MDWFLYDKDIRRESIKDPMKHLWRVKILKSF